MRRPIVLVALLCALTSSCGKNINSSEPAASATKSRPSTTAYSDASKCDAPTGYILNGKLSPQDDPPAHLRIHKDGGMEWNRSFANEIMLKDYFARVASSPQDDQFVSIEVEPGSSCSQIERIRQLAVDSGLCKKGKCAENKWNVARKFVN
jgi:hypothetical protein